MTKHNTLLAVLGCATLAACGGGASGPSYEAMVDRAVDIEQDANGRAFTLPTTLPVSGAATYDGVIGMSLSQSSRAVGELSLRADFSDDTISGDVANVRNNEEDILTGTLDIDNGRFFRDADLATEFTISADVDGRLRNGSTEFEVDARLVGDFIGTGYEQVRGNVDGDVTINDENTVQIIDGFFIAER